ncbi:hypothetical protein EON80_27120 [bacterium]|nr:MAG: hypothetical protein EON80_27120 [bacterium]
MSHLKWDEIDFLDCLEVFPTIDKYEMEHLYEVRKGELILSVKVEQYDSRVVLSLRQVCDVEPAIVYSFYVRDGVEYVKDRRGIYLEFQGCFYTTYLSPYFEYTAVELESATGSVIQVSIKPLTFSP